MTMNRNVSDDVFLRFAARFCSKVGTVKALGSNLLLESSHDEIKHLVIDPNHYSDATAFAIDFCVVEMVRKYTSLRTTVDKRAACSDTCEGAEQLCERTNRELNSRLSGNPEANAIFHRARSKIAQVLGPLCVGRCAALSGWSNGSTFDLRRGTTLDRKISSKLTVTYDAMPYAAAYLSNDWLWFEAISSHKVEGPFCCLASAFKLVPGNKWTTVAKTAFVDRPISIEPTMNIFLQKGAGAHIRQRLLRFGVDLSDQSLNQRLARDAFMANLATVDLSSASDTISISLVADLLPHDWFVFLDNLRSRRTYVDNVWRSCEKFSSMGNGFTFELESLIFWALSKATLLENNEASDAVCSVYGDDIIIPASSFTSLKNVLETAGFCINTRKSFWNGNYFESCGKHYFKGVDVTPFYQKESCIVSGRRDAACIIRLHNRFYRWCIRIFGNIPKTFRKLLSGLRDVMTPWFKVLPKIPAGCVDDRGLLTDIREFSIDRNHGAYCTVLQSVVKTRPGLQLPLYALKLRSTHSDAKMSDVFSHEKTLLKNVWIPIHSF